MSFTELVQHIKNTSNLKKIILLGDGGVGKTSLLYLLTHQSLPENIKKTPYVNISTFKTENNIKIQVIDLAGQKNLPIHMIQMNPELVFDKTDLIIFMFSNEDAQSLMNLQSWYSIIEQHYLNNSMPHLILVKSKCDLPTQIDESLVTNIYNTLKIPYIELSNKTLEGIDKLKQFLSTL